MQTIIENKIKGIEKKESNVWSAIAKSSFNYRENGHKYIQEVEKILFGAYIEIAVFWNI